METKNIVIQNYARSIIDAANAISGSAGNLTNNVDENVATVKTLNVLVESLRSQTILIQSAIDSYGE